MDTCPCYKILIPHLRHYLRVSVQVGLPQLEHALLQVAQLLGRGHGVTCGEAGLSVSCRGSAAPLTLTREEHREVESHARVPGVQADRLLVRRPRVLGVVQVGERHRHQHEGLGQSETSIEVT